MTQNLFKLQTIPKTFFYHKRHQFTLNKIICFHISTQCCVETERHNKHLNKRQQTQLDKKTKCCLLKKDALCSGSGPFYNGRCGSDKNEYIYQIWRNYFLAFLRYDKQKSANVKPPRIADTESQSLAADTVRGVKNWPPCCNLKGRYQIKYHQRNKTALI